MPSTNYVPTENPNRVLCAYLDEESPFAFKYMSRGKSKQNPKTTAFIHTFASSIMESLNTGAAPDLS